MSAGPIKIDLSAIFVCFEPISASECTATVSIPRRLHVDIILHAISPRLAIRIFLNISKQSTFEKYQSSSPLWVHSEQHLNLNQECLGFFSNLLSHHPKGELMHILDRFVLKTYRVSVS